MAIHSAVRDSSVPSGSLGLCDDELELFEDIFNRDSLSVVVFQHLDDERVDTMACATVVRNVGVIMWAVGFNDAANLTRRFGIEPWRIRRIHELIEHPSTVSASSKKANTDSQLSAVKLHDATSFPQTPEHINKQHLIKKCTQPRSGVTPREKTSREALP